MSNDLGQGTPTSTDCRWCGAQKRRKVIPGKTIPVIQGHSTSMHKNPDWVVLLCDCDIVTEGTA